MTRVLFSLGSNEGDPAVQLKTALELLRNSAGIEIILVSRSMVTRPWGNTDQPDFQNMAVLAETALTASACMEQLLHIESQMGRVRGEKWGPRLIDLDIILFGNEVIISEQLTVPHPYMQERMFVLEPSLEIAADMMHPLLNKTIRELFNECKTKTEPAVSA